MSHEKIFKEFCNWSQGHAKMVIDYKPWGSKSIIIWLSNGMLYKVKYISAGKFVMQTITEAEVKRKLENFK